MNWPGKLLTIVIGLIGMLLAACQPYQFQGTEYPDAIPAADFVLTDTSGQPFRLNEQRGKVVLLFFGYTYCPDVCPTTLAEVKRVMEGLGDERLDVRFLFITVDPERDTPEQLGQHLANFHPDMIGLTGTPETLRQVFTDYGIYAAKVPLAESTTAYTMDHTARLFLIDPQGRMRLSYAYGTPAEDILQDVTHLLNE
jgi:protein SCO1/2